MIKSFTVMLGAMLMLAAYSDGQAASAEGSAANPGSAARIAPEQWKPLAQPQLAQDFAKAQPAQTEDICDGPDMCYVDTGPRYWIPNRDGKSWDAVLFYSANYLVISTKTASDDKNTSYTPPRGMLFVFDTTTRQIIHAVEADFWWTPGYVTEALPGLVMGYAAPSNDASAQGGVLYGFDPAAGKVLWSKPVPHRPETARSMMVRGSFNFSKGPDGHIWATMAGVLARIDPVTAKVKVLGKLPDTALAFSQGEVCVGGATKLRRLVTRPERKSGD